MDYQTINPATEEVVKTFPIISDADLDKVIAKAHEALSQRLAATDPSPTAAASWAVQPRS